MTTAKPEIEPADTTAWPPLPLAAWQETCSALQRKLQIVGKTRLALAPMQNHWWQVTLYLSARGLTTSPVPYGERSFEAEFDFVGHQLDVRTSDGRVAALPLAAQSVADFHAAWFALLRSLDIEVSIRPVPSEMPDTLAFNEDHVHSAYDADAVQRCWRILLQVDRLFKQFRGRFVGKCSPSHFWWGGFDLACTRFSGRRAPPHPGGFPNLPDRVTREAYSHECISAGWWPGSVGSPVAEPAFYAYAYPEPPGCPAAPVRPDAAYWDTAMHEWILPYEAVRRAADPDAMVQRFLQSTWEAASGLGGWDRAALEWRPVP